MPYLDGTGPDKKNSGTGRELGNCRIVPKEEALEKLGKGMGLRRKSGGGQGQGKRLQSGLRVK